MSVERMSFSEELPGPDRLRAFKVRRVVQAVFVVVVAVVFAASCAVPVAPTGGPADDTPPRLVAGYPADGSTGFSGRTITLTFSEHVDRASLPGAVSLQPEPGGRLEFDWSGKTVEITLPDDPRPETTYILSIDNSLRDARNVALDRPITLAFATGETIDAGRLAGRVLRAHDGSPGADIDIYAYAAPDSALFLERPLYRTQTGSDGSFTFSYLREAEYFVVGVRDRNGNRRLDTNEDAAFPPVALIRADTLSGSPDSTGLDWVLERYDDVRPVMDRTVSAGRNHVEIRFSEPVRLLSPEARDLALHSAAGEPIGIREVYSSESFLSRIVGLHTDELGPGSYTLSGRFPVADSTGNAAAPGDLVIEIADSTDRRVPRVATFLPDSSAGVSTGTRAPIRLWPGDRAGIRFDIPAPDAVSDGLIAARDTSGSNLASRFLRSSANTWLFRDSSLTAPFELIVPPAVTPSDSTVVLTFVRADRSMTGELSGTVLTGAANDDVSSQIVVELYRDNGAGRGTGSRTSASRLHELPLRTVRAQESSFVVSGLPDGLQVRLRAFVDVNENGTWDAGQAVPFIPPEPIAWITATEPVRARWETALSDTLYLGFPE